MTADDLKILKDNFRSGMTFSPKQRIGFLKKIRSFIADNRLEAAEALRTDLGKCETEAMMSEIMPVLQLLDMLIKKTVKWSKPVKKSIAAVNFPSRGKLIPEPYGTVLVVSAWNYPLMLAVEPFAGAVAAGNCVVLSPAPSAAATADFLKRMVKECTPGITCCANSSPEELAKMDFDYIFFTGGNQTGRKVAAAAGANLTPSTLELGGKSPCFVTKNCNLKLTAKKIVWGKFLNAGQTCVAPDYILVEEDFAEKLIAALAETIKEFYGSNPAESPDYSRIVNDFHFRRLENLLQYGTVAAGGVCRAEDKYIAPTIITAPEHESPLMQYEIFGPLLPVITVKDLQEAVDFVNVRPKPLALYIFTAAKKEQDFIISNTSSGSVAVNDTVMQIMNPELPFGGVGASGYGAYHGKLTFDTFTHFKPVMTASSHIDFPVRYPPFREWQKKLVRLLTK